MLPLLTFDNSYISVNDCLTFPVVCSVVNAAAHIGTVNQIGLKIRYG